MFFLLFCGNFYGLPIPQLALLRSGAHRHSDAGIEQPVSNKCGGIEGMLTLARYLHHIVVINSDRPAFEIGYDHPQKARTFLLKPDRRFFLLSLSSLGA